MASSAEFSNSSPNRHGAPFLHDIEHGDGNGLGSSDLNTREGVEATVDRLFPRHALVRLMEVAQTFSMAIQTARNLHHHGRLPFPVSRLHDIVVMARHDLVGFRVSRHGRCRPQGEAKAAAKFALTAHPPPRREHPVHHLRYPGVGRSTSMSAITVCGPGSAAGGRPRR